MEIKPRSVKIAKEDQLMSVLNRSSWRTLAPFYETKASPCATACPLHNQTPEWINLLRQGKKEEAYFLLRECNPFPAICGKICHHPCEDNCSRGQFDEGINIRRLESYLGEYGLENFSYILPKPGTKKEKIAIIGAGPAGLSCAWYLLKEGYEIFLYEDAKKEGGMLTLAIPEFRLSSRLVRKEMEPIFRHSNINSRFSRRITKKQLNNLKERFSAVFIAIGSHHSKELDIPKEFYEPPRVISGLYFLKKAKHHISLLRKNVVIVGGGNTAIDAARSAKALGANVVICYRRTMKEIPAMKEEIVAALKEEVAFCSLVSPIAITDKEIIFQQMELGPPDESGRPKPIPKPGTTLNFKADKIIVAIGENRENPVINPADFENKENEGIFLGGDCLYGPGFVSKAIASGKETSLKIRKYLGEAINSEFVEPQKTVEFKDLNVAYFENCNKKKDVQEEANRCFSCGLCPENPEICSNCWKFCPDISVEIINHKPRLDYDHCKGCLVCRNECPRGVISIKEGKEKNDGEKI